MKLWHDYDGIGAVEHAALDHGILLAGVSFQVGGVVLFMKQSTIPWARGLSWPIEIGVTHSNSSDDNAMNYFVTNRKQVQPRLFNISHRCVGITLIRAASEGDHPRMEK